MQDEREQAEPPMAGPFGQHQGASSQTDTATIPTSDSIDVSRKAGLDAMSLAKWNKLAERGGIGKAVALNDCMADRKGDLMFLAGDEITVLRALTADDFLGYCEGVIGRFYRSQVHFHDPSRSSVASNRIPKALSLDPVSGDQTVVEDLPLRTSTVNDKAIDESSHSGDLGQETLGNERKEVEKGVGTAPSVLQTNSTTGKENAFNSVEQSKYSFNSPERQRRASQDIFDSTQPTPAQNIPLNSTSPSIASSWSRHPSVDDSRTQYTAADSVAMALRSFGKAKDPEEDSIGRTTRRSRDSSLLGSENSWSSTHESDEISEGSIHYPTISFIDRIKALRIPATQAQPDVEALSGNFPAPEPLDDEAQKDGEIPRADVMTNGSVVVHSASPPPRPLKSRLRSPHAEETDNVASESAERTETMDVAEAEEGRNETSRTQTHAQTADPSAVDELAGGPGGGDAVSVQTEESNPFEFGIGVSAPSTPNERVTPAIEAESTQLSTSQSSASNGPVTKTQGGETSRPTLTVPGGSLVAGVARELANRFSSTSEILRKHHIDDEGEQSYFPVVAGQAVPEEDKAPFTSAMVSIPQEEIPSLEPVSSDDATHPTTIPTNPSSNVVTLASPISDDNSRTPRNATVGLGLEPSDNSDAWNILDHYVDRPPPDKASHGDEDLMDRIADDTKSPVIRHTDSEPQIVKKKASGILKIRTTASSQYSQLDNSPQSVLTPTSVPTFHASPEGSSSPDTHRFRAFAMHFPSPSQTPTKSPSDKRLFGSLSGGQKSAEATKLVQEDTLHGQLAMDLTSARNPVPINFLLGQSTSSPVQATEDFIGTYGTPPQRQERGSPSPANGKHSPKTPSSPFFPSRSGKSRARSFSIVEVPLPMHRSDSSNSLKTAYAGIMQNGHVAYQQGPDEQEDKVKRSLSRKSSAKLSAFRRKLSLKGEERPDMSLVSEPQLPSSPSMHLGGASMSGLDEQRGITAENTESQSLPPIPSMPKVREVSNPSPSMPPAQSFKLPVKESPPARAESSAASPISKSPSPPSIPVYDEYGYLAKHSPVPPSFAPIRVSQTEVSKLEQTLFTLTDQTPTSSSSRKVKNIVESYLAPSVRGRVWKWLLKAPALPHQRYQTYIDSFDIPQLEIDPSLVARFGNHRVFMHGFQSVQQMMFLYITRHRNAPPPPDTVWIASLFLTQSFHDADGYALYESFLGRLSECWTGPALRNWAQVIQEAIQAHDAELAKHLAKCPDLYYTLIRRWSLTMFAEAMPLPTCLRAMDLVITQGTSAILKLASVIILLCTKRLLAITDPSDIVSYLLQPTQEWLSPENVIRNMGKIALPKKGFLLPKLGSPRT